METKALYRKYRPKTVEDYMGDRIKNVVLNRFTVPENRPNVILIEGEHGCGKTTIARILSKYYLCENPVNGKPCEECASCREINDALINGEAGVETTCVREIDATTAGGKEEIQAIIQDAIEPPMYGEYKIIIFDECHKISPAAQNSLLKIIEDIPKHLIVFFATTERDKVLDTIRSRCQLTLEVSKHDVDELADRLLFICKQEKFQASLEALRVIAKKADRIPRDAINLLEAVAKNSNNIVTIETVNAQIGDIASELYFKYLEASYSSLEEILEFNMTLKELGKTPAQFIEGFVAFIMDCLYVKHAISLEDYSSDFVDKVKELFNNYTSSQFDTLLQVVEMYSREIGTNEAKGQLFLTNMAIKISKLDMIADGDIAEETVKVEKENKLSMEKYRELMQQAINEENDKEKPEMIVETASSDFESAMGTEVEDFEAEESKADEDSGDFLSTEDLMKLAED